MKVRAIFSGGRYAPEDYEPTEVTIVAFLLNAEDDLIAVYLEGSRIRWYEAAYFKVIEEPK